MSGSTRYVVTVALLLSVSLATAAAGAGTAAEGCPRHMGSLLVSPSSVAVSGTTAFLSTYWAGITAVDVSNPTEPRRLGTLLGDFAAIAVADQYAFVADHDSHDDGLRVVDISDPARMQVVATADVEYPLSIVIDDGYAYASNSEGLFIVDIADPLQPSVVSHAPMLLDEYTSNAALAVDNGLVCYHYGAEVIIIDATDAGAPVQVGRIRTAGEVNTVAVSGATVCAIGYAGLTVIDASEPSRPVMIGFTAGPISAYAATIVDQRILVTGQVLSVYDISTPASPQLISTLPEAGGIQIVVDGAHAYQAGAWLGPDFLVLDLQDLDHPAVLGSLDLPSGLHEAVIRGQYAYVATWDDDNSGGLLVVDISDPTVPREIRLLKLGARTAIVVGEDHAYLAWSGSRLAVVDISNPGRPRSAGWYSLPGNTTALALEGDLLAAADYDGAIHTVDLSDPVQPQLLATLDTAASVHDVALSESYAFAAVDSAGLLVVDSSDPAQPLVVGSLDTPGQARGVAVLGSTVYLADDDGGLRVIDVSDPAHPIEVTSFTPLINAIETVAVSDGHLGQLLLAAEWGNIVRLFDVSSPGEPIEIGRLDQNAGHLSLAGDLALLTSSSYDGGLHLFDTAACLPRVSTWIGIAAHQAGSFGSTWVTDLVVDNPLDAPTPIELLLHTPSGTHQAEGTIMAGAQGVFEDVVGIIGSDGLGALEVRASRPLDMIARIANQTEEGTFGQLLQGYRSADGLAQGESARLLGLRQRSGAYRSNLNITNTADTPATVQISLFTTAGELLLSYSQEVAPGQAWQDIEPFRQRAGAGDLGWGFAEVEVVSGAGVLVSASVIDSRTNDATTSSPVRY